MGLEVPPGGESAWIIRHSCNIVRKFVAMSTCW